MLSRQASNVQVLNGNFLGDLQRDYDEKGYEIFDWVLETHPLEYFKALVQLSKIVRWKPMLGTGMEPSRALSMRFSRGRRADWPERSCRIREVLSEGKTDASLMPTKPSQNPHAPLAAAWWSKISAEA